MLRRFDRLVLRVESLPAATRYWESTYGAQVLREDRHSAALRLPDGGDVVLHSNPDLPEQAFYLLVDDVRAMHANRASLRLDFRTPPTRGSRGYFATVRDPFGVILHLADQTGDAAGEPAGPAAPVESDSAGLFGPTRPKHKPDRPRLAELYRQLGRTADDLPYTTHFESLYGAYIAGFPDPKPDEEEVWRHLLTTRKAGQLPRLGAARSSPPDVTDDDRRQLRDLLGTDIGKRDRLPYSRRFDDLVARFNAGRRRPFSPHQVWRLVATLSK